MNKITQEHINQIISNTEEKIWEPFPGVTIVSWKLPSGFVITDQSGCVDPSNYDREIGVSIARIHLENKLWELEGYLLKNQLAKVD